MLVVRSNLRKMVAGAACLVVVVMFSGCGKDGKELPKEPPSDPLIYDEGVVINGVKWATRNVDEVGKFALTPESVGKFYQWNRKKAWNTTDSIVSGWDSTIPEGTEWVKAKDPSPAGWRVPTFEEVEKLLDTDKVTSEWTSKNGVTGRKFIDKASGNNLFFPTVGWRKNSDSRLTPSKDGLYWSSTQYNDSNAYYLVFGDDSGYETQCTKTIRNFGFNIRSVAE